jgi:hypothetical protein
LTHQCESSIYRVLSRIRDIELTLLSESIDQARSISVVALVNADKDTATIVGVFPDSCTDVSPGVRRLRPIPKLMMNK